MIFIGQWPVCMRLYPDSYLFPYLPYVAHGQWEITLNGSNNVLSLFRTQRREIKRNDPQKGGQMYMYPRYFVTVLFEKKASVILFIDTKSCWYLFAHVETTS